MKGCKWDIFQELTTLVAVGSNLPGPDGIAPLVVCRRAVDDIAGLSGVRVTAVSPWYRGGAIPAGSGPDYVNGCVRLASSLSPQALLSALQAIEGRFGRVRSRPNAPRTLDLDIVAMGDVVSSTPDPVLPHPRAHVRAFVLRPLADIWPGWVHPVLREPVEALLADLGPQSIERL